MLLLLHHHLLLLFLLPFMHCRPLTAAVTPAAVDEADSHDNTNTAAAASPLAASFFAALHALLATY